MTNCNTSCTICEAARHACHNAVVCALSLIHVTDESGSQAKRWSTCIICQWSTACISLLSVVAHASAQVWSCCQ